MTNNQQPHGHYAEATRVFQSEIDGLRSVLDAIRPTFDQAVDAILQCPGKVVVTGLGKSGIVGHKIAATLASTGTPSLFMNASEALHGDLGMVSKGDVVLMLSNSASTVELMKMLPSLRRSEARVIGIFGSKETPLARNCDIVLEAKIEKEACPLNLAPMTSATAALVIGDALAAALMQARRFTADQFAVFHPGGLLGRRLLLKVSDVMNSDANLPVVAPTASLREVLLEITRVNLGGVCVCEEGNRLTGFISDGDIRRHLLETGAIEGLATDLMTRNPTTISPTATLSEALDLMESRQRKIYVIPVVAPDTTCVGLLRMHDIISER